MRTPPRRPVAEQLELRRHLHAGHDHAVAAPVVAQASDVTRVNFGPANMPTAAYSVHDSGQTYANRNGLTYGWSADNTANARYRPSEDDVRYATFNHTQKNGNFKWELAVPNGTYSVRVVAGDADYADSFYKFTVENATAVNAAPTASQKFREETVYANVSDGRLTISNASGAANNKLAFVEVRKGTSRLPVVSVAAVDDDANENGAQGRFRFTRTGWNGPALTVDYDVTGSATNGADYGFLTGSVTFASGQSTVDVLVEPTADSNGNEGTESAGVQLYIRGNYSTDRADFGVVRIGDAAVNPDPGGNEVTNVSWSSAPTPPKSYAEWQSAVVGGKLYLMGGFNNTWNPVNDLWRFDPANGSYTKLANLPVRLTHALPAVVDGEIWLAGGYVGKDPSGQIFGTRGVWAYNVASNTWRTGPQLPVERAGGGLVAVGRKLFYFGGQNLQRTQDTPEMWALDLDNPSAGWQSRAAMPQARNHVSALNVNGQIWVLGGQTGYDDNLVGKRDVFKYDPASNSWTTLAWKLPQPVSHTSYTTLLHNNRVYIVGGERAHNQPTSAVWKVNLTTGATDVLNSLPDARLSPGGAVLNGKLFIAGGYGGGQFKTNAFWGTLS